MIYMEHVRRVYMPGSQWVYFKLYTGKIMSDELLLKHILPVIRSLIKYTHIDKWYYVRYSDPDYHLRLRVLAVDESSVNNIIKMFYKEIVSCHANGLVWKVQLDTYNRELERYGKNLIEEAESVFCADSICIVSILKQIGRNEQLRWMISFKLIDSLLTDFLLDVYSKQQILESLNNDYKKEFGFNDFNMKQLNTKYRTYRKIIENVIENRVNDILFSKLYRLIKNKSRCNSFFVKTIYEKRNNNDSNVSINSLLKSHIHMMLNRLFCDKNRMYEMVIYNFMNKYYKSLIAKEIYK